MPKSEVSTDSLWLFNVDFKSSGPALKARGHRAQKTYPFVQKGTAEAQRGQAMCPHLCRELASRRLQALVSWPPQSPATPPDGGLKGSFSSLLHSRSRLRVLTSPNSEGSGGRGGKAAVSGDLTNQEGQFGLASRPITERAGWVPMTTGSPGARALEEASLGHMRRLLPGLRNFAGCLLSHRLSQTDSQQPVVCWDCLLQVGYAYPLSALQEATLAP